MATPALRPTFTRSETDQVDDAQPSKKTATVATGEVRPGNWEATSSASDIKKKPYEDGSGSENEIVDNHFENLVLDDSEIHYSKPVEDAMDLVTEVLHVDDDTSLNPWTFRM